MVNRLEIHWGTKWNLKKTLKKFPMIFVGNLGKLKSEKAHITLKEGMKPYTDQYFNLQKAYKVVAKKEIYRMVAIGILQKVKWNEDSIWAAVFFCQPKNIKDLQIMTDFWSWMNQLDDIRFLFLGYWKRCRNQKTLNQKQPQFITRVIQNYNRQIKAVDLYNRWFISMINFFRNIWIKKSLILVLLPNIGAVTDKKKR